MQTLKKAEAPTIKYRKDYRAPDYTITDIHLDFQLDPQNTIVTATSSLLRKAENAVDLVLDGEEMTLKLLEIDGQAWPHFTQNDLQLIIHSPKENPLPENFTLKIVTHLKPVKNTALEGLYQSGEALCTQCEAEGFRRITYYLDRPDVLARYTTRITADKTAYPFLLSNGNKIASGELANNQHWVEWQDPFPKPSYLFALVAGDFDCLKDSFTTQSGRKVALELFVDKGNLDRADWAMESIKASMKWDETRFGLEYDLDIYMVVAVDFFNMGAMENKGLNIFNSKFVLAKRETATDIDYQNIESIIGHEYFHNWTGNRITCRDWFQLSLKEGLTVFRDQEFSADLGSRELKRIDDVRLLRTTQFAEDASPMSHPIRPDQVMEMNNFYTVTVYEKGAEVIRMLHTLLGEEHFQSGMKIYIERHDGSAATCDDFVQAMQDAANQANLGLELTQFKLWYSQSGTPIIHVKDEFDAELGIYRLHIEQNIPPTADQAQKLPMMIPFSVDLYSQAGVYLPIEKHYKQAESAPYLLLTQASETFEFHNLNEKPVPAFLRDFSAPVKLEYAYQHSDLLTLMQFAQNAFIRWDAAQMVWATLIKQAVHSLQNDQSIIMDSALIEVYRALLTSSELREANQGLGLATELLTMPSALEVAEWFKEIDPINIDKALRQIKAQLGKALENEFTWIYQYKRLAKYEFTHQAMAQRALVNLALSYLAYANVNGINELLNGHFTLADNMTDKMAALNSAVQANLPVEKALLAEFEDAYKSDSLVMDKWLTAQALSPAENVLSNVKSLMKHPSFAMQNPNRVRALVGAFVMQNQKAFHAQSGEGYQFLTEILTILNESNPQVASRIIEPLLRFKRYDATRQLMMKDALNNLKALPNLSRDLFEKITKALESA